MTHADNCQYWNAWQACVRQLLNGNPHFFEVDDKKTGIDCAVAEIKRLQDIAAEAGKLLVAKPLRKLENPNEPC